MIKIILIRLHKPWKSTRQNLKLWAPLLKSIYQLRLLTRHYQNLQELKNQSANQRNAVLHSRTIDKFTLKHLEKLIKLYDKQLDETKKEIAKLIEKDLNLKVKIAQLCQIKGLALLSVATIVAETNGFAGFESIRQLVSFSGYDAVENQSGQKAGKPVYLKRVTAESGEFYTCRLSMLFASGSLLVKPFLKAFSSVLKLK